jgi:hypothetical protein
MKKLGMFAGHPFIPVAKGLPTIAVCRRPKDVAFAGQDKVRMDRELEVGQAGLEQVYRSPGVMAQRTPSLCRVPMYSTQPRSSTGSLPWATRVPSKSVLRRRIFGAIEAELI